jgi:tetratricopeptide (TPR) repeat protein
MSVSQRRKSDEEKMAALAKIPVHPGQSAVNINDLQQLFNSGRYSAVIEQGKALRGDQSSSTLDNLLAQAHVGQAQTLIKKNKLSEAGNHHSLAVRLSDDTESPSKKIAQLSRRLANEYYERGRALLRSNINQGIEYLQTSLKYYPDDRRVVALLRSSLVMRDRLSKINNKK